MTRPLRDRPPRPWAESAGVGAVVAAVFLVTLSDNHSETENSLEYAERIQVDPYSDAPHLGWDWVGWAWYQAVRLVGLADGSLRPLQVMNAILGAAAVALLWLVVRRAGQSRVVAFTAAGLLAFSYGFWWNSVEAEVYALSAVLMMLCLGLAYEAVLRPTWRRFALVGVVNGLAVLAHIQNVYFAGVVAAALVLASRGGAVVSWSRSALAYVAGAGAVVVPAYALAAAVLRLGSLDAVHAWFSDTTGEGQYGNLDPEMVPKGIVAAGRAIIGGHFALSFDSVRSALIERFPGRPLVEEEYFLRGYSGALAVAPSPSPSPSPSPWWPASPSSQPPGSGARAWRPRPGCSRSCASPAWSRTCRCCSTGIRSTRSSGTWRGSPSSSCLRCRWELRGASCRSGSRSRSRSAA